MTLKVTILNIIRTNINNVRAEVFNLLTYDQNVRAKVTNLLTNDQNVCVDLITSAWTI